MPTNTEPNAFDAQALLWADAAVREMAPAMLEARGLTNFAEDLRALPPITDQASAHAACTIVRALERFVARSGDRYMHYILPCAAAVCACQAAQWATTSAHTAAEARHWTRYNVSLVLGHLARMAD